MHPNTANRIAALVVLAVLAVFGPIALGPTTATADDAGKGIHTEKNRCVPAAEPGARRLDCIVIYRNTTHRPVFDIGIDVRIGGQSGTVVPSGCCPRGTRQALAPGESAVFIATVSVPAGVPDGAPVAVTYRASSTGDAGALDVPRPELQYIDRFEQDGQASYRAEVRNVDGRTWRAIDDYGGRSPIAVYFQRGKVVGAHTVASRLPMGRIPADGRALVDTGPLADTPTDAVQLFFGDEFQGALPPDRTDVTWQVTKLDYGLVPVVGGEPGEPPEFRYTITVRNPTAATNTGNIHLIARRHDYHAIGGDSCGLARALTGPDQPSHSPYFGPGQEATCSDRFPLFSGYTPDDVRFVTVELGDGIAILPTPPTATPCPARATPAAVPTVANVVGRVWLPWSIRMLPESCP